MTAITKPLAILHLGDRWLAQDSDYIQVVSPFPKLSSAISVVETFGDSPSGVMRLQGKTAHAEALVERKIRAEGLVDGESRVLIHHQRTVAGAMEVLFTAVPLPIWQTISGWTQQQRDHCVLLPIAALACAGIKEGQGRVIRYGANLVYFANTSDGFIYASVTAYSDAEEDVEIAVRSLAEQAAGNARGTGTRAFAGSAEKSKAQSIKVFWCPLYADGEEDQRMQQLFVQIAKCDLEDCSQGALNQVDAEGNAVSEQKLKTALPQLLKRANLRTSANTGSQRLVAFAEAWAPLSTVLVGACAAALFAYGGYNHTIGAQMNSNAALQNAKSAKSEEMVRQLDAKQAPTEYENVQKFVNTLQAGVTGYNPAAVVADIGNAAGREIRILRIRLENISNKPLSMVFDGALRPGVDGSAITTFLLQLRRTGYVVTSMDPADGGQSGNFTYRLTRAPVSVKAQSIALNATTAESQPKNAETKVSL